MSAPHWALALRIWPAQRQRVSSYLLPSCAGVGGLTPLSLYCEREKAEQPFSSVPPSGQEGKLSQVSSWSETLAEGRPGPFSDLSFPDLCCVRLCAEGTRVRHSGGPLTGRSFGLASTVVQMEGRGLGGPVAQARPR